MRLILVAILSSGFLLLFARPALAQSGNMAIGDTVSGYLPPNSLGNSWEFDGEAGQIIRACSAGDPGLVLSLTLQGDGITDAERIEGDFPTLDFLLPQTGHYALFVSPQGNSWGSYTLSLVDGNSNCDVGVYWDMERCELTECPPRPLGFGSARNDALLNPTSRDFWIFEGIANQVVDIFINTPSGSRDDENLLHIAAILSFGDQIIAEEACSTGMEFGYLPYTRFENVVLPATGTYTLTLSVCEGVGIYAVGIGTPPTADQLIGTWEPALYAYAGAPSLAFEQDGVFRIVTEEPLANPEEAQGSYMLDGYTLILSNADGELGNFSMTLVGDHLTLWDIENQAPLEFRRVPGTGLPSEPDDLDAALAAFEQSMDEQIAAMETLIALMDEELNIQTEVIANALEVAMTDSTTQQALDEDVIVVIEASADLTSIAIDNGLEGMSFVCAPITALSALDDILGLGAEDNPLYAKGDYFCTVVGAGADIVMAVLNGNTPLGLVPLLLEPDKYVDPWLDPINEFTWRFTLTCTLFPDATVCK